jgi:hypothetical protein
MEDFAGFHGHTRPKHACIVLHVYNTLYLISAEKVRTFDDHLRLFPAFWTIWDLKIRKMGIKFDELLIANERHF